MLRSDSITMDMLNMSGQRLHLLEYTVAVQTRRNWNVSYPRLPTLFPMPGDKLVKFNVVCCLGLP